MTPQGLSTSICANLAGSAHDEATLRSSIATVAAHRTIDLLPLSEVLADYPNLAQSRWAAWRRKQGLDQTPEAFADLLDDVIAFADPLLEYGRRQP